MISVVGRWRRLLWAGRHADARWRPNGGLVTYLGTKAVGLKRSYFGVSCDRGSAFVMGFYTASSVPGIVGWLDRMGRILRLMSMRIRILSVRFKHFNN